MRNKRPNGQNTNKGITLIALVITIIVMLILVAVTITMAVNGGLFEYAQNAGTLTNGAITNEQLLANGGVTIGDQYYNSIDEFVNSQEVEQDIPGIDGEVFTALYKETKEYEDVNGDIAVIPKGFSVGKSTGINTVEDGLVIQDAKGNQFVWIPVEYTKSNTLDENGLDTGFLEVFKTNRSEDNGYFEPYYDEENTEYYDMMLSVQENKGFYLGRFEAGTEDERYKGVANGEDTLVIKRDVYPYNVVAWGKESNNYEGIIKYDFNNNEIDDENGLDQGRGAAYLSKHLLDGQTTEAVSTLCYGVQWEAMLNFIGNEYDVQAWSPVWGNYRNNGGSIITRTTACYSIGGTAEWIQVTGEGINEANLGCCLLTTGASDQFETKNLYDVAGNCEEWTMECQEVYNEPVEYRRMLRGGEFEFRLWWFSRIKSKQRCL